MIRQTKNGTPFQIRRPVENDAEAIISYSKKVFASTDQVLNTLEEYTITVDDEKAWINSFNQNPNALALVADLNGQIVGLLFFVPNGRKKNFHTGEFGISVDPEFQGLSIGRQLIESLLSWATLNSKIEKVYLQVFATNLQAIALYKQLEFVEEGRHIKAAKQADGSYVDVLQMYRWVK
jgi:RimJ/RimL family protein N-acetyltransferase